MKALSFAEPLMDMDKARVSLASLAPSVRLYINRARRVQGPGAQPGMRGEDGWVLWRGKEAFEKA